MPDHESSEPILLTLEGNNGKIELMETKVKIALYKERHHLGFGRKFDNSKINKVHEIPRDAITKAELANALGTHQFHIHFPGAGLMGHVNVFLNEDQIPEAEKMIKMLTGIGDQGLKHAGDGEFSEAIQAVDKSDEIKMPLGSVNEKSAASATSLYNEGVVHFNKREYSKANQAFDRAIEYDPNNALSWYYKSAALYFQHKYDEAIKACDKAIQLKPNDSKAHTIRGSVLMDQGKFDEALIAIDRALELDPKLAAAKNAKNLILGKLGNAQGIVKIPEKGSKNITKILQKRGISPNEVLLSEEGANGQIILTDNGVIIGREGFWKKVVSESYTKGDKLIPYKNITGVQFKDPGMTWGYIQFTLPGGIESRGGSWDAAKDENTVTFHNDRSLRFRKIRDIVEERIHSPSVPQAQAPPALSIADELGKLANLKKDGLISDEEYSQLKKKLIGN